MNTLIMTLIMVVIAVAASNIILQDAHAIKRLNYSARAQYLAESGIDVALAGLADKFDLSVFPLNGTIGADTYSVDALETGGRVMLTSEGTVTRGAGAGDDVKRTVSAEVEDLTPDSMYYIMSAGTDVWIRGGFISLTDIDGSVHGNNDVSLKTGLLLGAVDVSDEATCWFGKVYIRTFVGWVAVNGISYGPFTDSSFNWKRAGGPINFPNFDYAYYKQLAIDSGDYYAGAHTFDGVTLNPGNGVVYVDGKATIEGTCDLYGGLVADEIELDTKRLFGIIVTKRARLNQHKAGPINAIVSRNKDFSVDGELNAAEALIYAGNDFVSLTTGSIINVTGVITASRDIRLWEFLAYIDYNYRMPDVQFGPNISMVKIVSWNR